MFTRILTNAERKHIAKYLARDGEKAIQVRKLVYGSRKHLSRIKADLALIEKLLETYSKNGG